VETSDIRRQTYDINVDFVSDVYSKSMKLIPKLLFLLCVLQCVVYLYSESLSI
jgi:hypothetical protein